MSQTNCSVGQFIVPPPPTKEEKNEIALGVHWATSKTILLGWDFDTVAGTLNPPPHRLARLYELLDAFSRTRKRAPIKEWHRLLGELRSMAPVLPGARDLFSTLQDALSRGDRSRVRLNSRVFDSLEDFRCIANSLSTRPTRFREVVAFGPPVAYGACDACQRGMGGVWFRPGYNPIVWHVPFPAPVQRCLVTSANRGGTISISDLELAGTLAHKHILVKASGDLAERPIWLAGDNRASISWATKGSSTSVSAHAYLLRLTALHQRTYQYVPSHDYIAGRTNTMADDASRRWDLDDHTLLVSLLNSSYPQDMSWTMLTLQASTTSAVIGALLRQRSIPISLTIDMPHPLARGASGSSSAPPTEFGPTCRMSTPTPSLLSSCLRNVTAPGPSRPVRNPSALAQWRTPSAT